MAANRPDQNVRARVATKTQSVDGAVTQFVVGVVEVAMMSSQEEEKEGESGLSKLSWW